MTVRASFFLTFALCAGLAAAADSDYTIGQAGPPPQELAKDVQAVLAPQGTQVRGPKGMQLEVWLVKQAAVKPGFSPSANQKYPFTAGELLGALRLGKGTKFTDFRAQDVPAGVYTLRYGVQPMDGNHIGTADTADFLLALPAGVDKDPGLIRFAKQLYEKSSESVESDHPSILWLAPPTDKPAGKPAVVHDEDHDFWILDTSVKGDDGKQIPIRLVIVGEGAV